MTTEHLRPFWRDFEDEGLTVGVLDMPYAPRAAATCGFEIAEWGAHDKWLGGRSVSPSGIASEIDSVHPFSTGELDPVGTYDRIDLATIARGCVTGAQRKGDLAEKLLRRVRPDVALVVFGEMHRVGHDLWHTLNGDSPLHDGLPADERVVSPGIVDVYREVDRQVGRLVDTLGPDAAVVVFSLHGFRPTRGLVRLLEPALMQLGYSQLVASGNPTGRSVVRGALAGVKRLTPVAVKRVYHRRLPRSMRYRLAAPTMLPALDWGRTRAFAVPSDQHGWIRVNLRGREAAGIVAAADYMSVREEVADAVGRLTDDDGRPLVADVMYPDPDGVPELLPDLIVHWTDAAFADPLRVAGLDVEVSPVGQRITGQHKVDGFCVAAGVDGVTGDSIDSTDLHRLLRP